MKQLSKGLLEFLESSKEGSKQPLGTLLLSWIDRPILCWSLPWLLEILMGAYRCHSKSMPNTDSGQIALMHPSVSACREGLTSWTLSTTTAEASLSVLLPGKGACSNHHEFPKRDELESSTTCYFRLLKTISVRTDA
jgi:hypothetical protein